MVFYFALKSASTASLVFSFFKSIVRQVTAIKPKYFWDIFIICECIKVVLKVQLKTYKC